MGHLSSAEKEHLLPLVKRLNQFPLGAPESGELYEILSILYTKEEALIASRFPLLESTLEELSRRMEQKPGDLMPVLDRMLDKGLITDSHYGGKTFYVLSPLLIGLFEFTFMKTRDDISLQRLAELLKSYESGSLGREIASLRTPMGRVVPYDGALSGLTTEVLSYERARELIRITQPVALTMCYCRHKSLHLGESCGHPVQDICMSFGRAADFLSRRGFARAVSVDDALAVLSLAEERGLVHILDNVRENPTFLCHCCPCCCLFFTTMRRFSSRNVVSPGSLAANIGERCRGCGKCVSLCPAKAIAPGKDGRGAVDQRICLGCGLCVVKCPAEAITLMGRKRRAVPPKNFEIKYMLAALSRGKALPYVPEAVKRLFRKFPF